MSARLPFAARTASGDVYDVEFELHPDTGSPMAVGQLVSALLETLGREIAIRDEVSNGDALQAMAMAMAVRATMIEAPERVTHDLARRLLDDALASMGDARHRRAGAGHA